MAFQPEQSNGNEENHSRHQEKPNQDIYLSTETKSKPNSLGKIAIHAREFWGKNIVESTGYNFLTGASLRAAVGLISGFKSIEATDTRWHKISRVLNGSAQTSRKLGSFCGIVGLIYTGIRRGRLINVRHEVDGGLMTGVVGLGTFGLSTAVGGPRSIVARGVLCGLAIGITHYCHPIVRVDIDLDEMVKGLSEEIEGGTLQ